MPGVAVVLGDTAANVPGAGRRVSAARQLFPAERAPRAGADLGCRPLLVRPRRAPARHRPGTAPPSRGGGCASPTLAVAERWRALSRAKGLSIRQTVIEASGRQSFVGTPETVAAELDEFVTARPTASSSSPI